MWCQLLEDVKFPKNSVLGHSTSQALEQGRQNKYEKGNGLRIAWYQPEGEHCVSSP